MIYDKKEKGLIYFPPVFYLRFIRRRASLLVVNNRGDCNRYSENEIFYNSGRRIKL